MARAISVGGGPGGVSVLVDDLWVVVALWGEGFADPVFEICGGRGFGGWTEDQVESAFGAGEGYIELAETLETFPFFQLAKSCFQVWIEFSEGAWRLFENPARAFWSGIVEELDGAQ